MGRRTEECINYLPSWGGTIFFQGGNRVRARRAICHRQILRRNIGKENVRFRIPPQLYGLGILDGIQDREILGRHNETALIRAELRIIGEPNRSGNDGTITRFGWKAQKKAYNVEMGVTNDLFPQATDEAPNCTANKSEPNDIFRNDPTDERNQWFNNPRTCCRIGRCSRSS
jgi:CxxC motif-containing protein (DUF1111 family)